MGTFNQVQLDAIEARARECQKAHSDELSVSKAVHKKNSTLFGKSELFVLAFLADECRRQESGPLSVYWMATAYNYAVDRKAEGGPLSADDVVSLLRLVEPEVNARGFRCVPVTFGNGNRIGFENIERQIHNLVGAQDVLEPLEFYIEFEKIHPGADGNGRVGAILFNFLQASLGRPVTPPEVKFD